jgi:hypothetical protein
VFKRQVFIKKTIWDIIKTSNEHEFALALDNQGNFEGGGLMFLKLFRNRMNKLEVIENHDELYFKN